MTTISMWRWPVSEVKLGNLGLFGKIGLLRKFQPVAEDRGGLTRARQNSRGWFQFSELGDARRPLVLIGSRTQVLEYFKQHAASGIENTVPGLPHIYIGISSFEPRPRYRKVTPLNDAAFKIFNWSLGVGTGPYMPGPISSIGSAGGTLYEYVRKVLRPGIEESPVSSGLVCVKFSYLREPGMSVVGRRMSAFGAYDNGIGLEPMSAR